MSYDKRPYQSSAENIHRYGKYEERPQFNSTQMEHDRTSQGSSERGFRRSTTSLDVQVSLNFLACQANRTRQLTSNQF